MKHILVADLMTRTPITVKPDLSLQDAARTMVKKRIGTLLLVEKTRLVGVLSRKDILWALIKKSKDDLSKIRSIDISPKKLATIKPSATMNEALAKMKKLKLEKLPVIQDGELVGLITARDILNFHPELYTELDEFAQIREEAAKLKRLKKPSKEGVCEECGRFEMLTSVHGNLICESCRESM